MLGTPLVPMMLLTAMTDCSPVTALCPPWNTATSPPGLPAHLARRVVDHGLLQRNPGLGQPWADSFKTFKTRLLIKPMKNR
jgi:hypothetical protein